MGSEGQKIELWETVEKNYKIYFASIVWRYTNISTLI